MTTNTTETLYHAFAHQVDQKIIKIATNSQQQWTQGQLKDLMNEVSLATQSLPRNMSLSKCQDYIHYPLLLQRLQYEIERDSLLVLLSIGLLATTPFYFVNSASITATLPLPQKIYSLCLCAILAFGVHQHAQMLQHTVTQMDQTDLPEIKQFIFQLALLQRIETQPGTRSSTPVEKALDRFIAKHQSTESPHHAKPF